MNAPVIVILNQTSLSTAERIRAGCPGAEIHGLRRRVEGVQHDFDTFAEHVRALYLAGRPLVVLCAAGIVIRTLAPLLQQKTTEPAVLAVAEDGSAVVPLLGGVNGVNRWARHLGELLGVAPAITTSGELRFGTCLLQPPDGYVLADMARGKHFVADLLGGAPVRVEGHAPWLECVDLPLQANAGHVIRVSPALPVDDGMTLHVYPRSVLVHIESAGGVSVHSIMTLLHDLGIATQAVAALLARESEMANETLQALAAATGWPLRFISDQDSWLDRPDAAMQWRRYPVAAGSVTAQQEASVSGVSLWIADAPVDIDKVGRRRGSLAVIGLGPGAAGWLAPDARQALAEADDVLGYETYVRMAGPFAAHQCLHMTDNREEMQRAAHAFALAAQGRRVVMVSSGDPGIFAMAAAVLEALHASDDPAWHAVDLHVVPGISAAMAAASRAGAPLGHDFCLISLSDNLKPWSVIIQRLRHAAAADLVMAFYNPVSKARPWQLTEALDILRSMRHEETRVVLGRDIGRPGECLITTTLGELQPHMVDMRTVVIIGSSTTRGFPRPRGGEWIYTPRWYPKA